MAFAATLANDLHMGPLALPWMLASSYRSKKRMNMCVCVCVRVCEQRTQTGFERTQRRTRVRTKTLMVANMPVVALSG